MSNVRQFHEEQVPKHVREREPTNSNGSNPIEALSTQVLDTAWCQSSLLLKISGRQVMMKLQKYQGRSKFTNNFISTFLAFFSYFLPFLKDSLFVKFC